MSRPFVAATVAAVVLAIGCGPADSGTGRNLLSEAADFNYPSLYRFTDRPDADQLMECLVGDQTVVGVVDTQRGTAAFGFESGAFPRVIWTPDRVYVRADLVTDESTTDWLSIERSAPLDQKAALGDALGPSLEAYSFASELPEHAGDLARGASHGSSTIEFSGGSAGTQTVTAVVSDETLVVAGGGSSGEDLELEFVIDEAGTVESVGVRSVDKASDGTQSFGFTLTFDWYPIGAAVVVPPASSVTNIAGVDVSSLRPAKRVNDCSIGP